MEFVKAGALRDKIPLVHGIVGRPVGILGHPRIVPPQMNVQTQFLPFFLHLFHALIAAKGIVSIEGDHHVRQGQHRVVIGQPFRQAHGFVQE